MTTTYDVEVTQDGKWWMVAIPALDGLTRARRLSDVDDAAREFIASHLDVEPREVEVRHGTARVRGLERLGEELAALAAEKNLAGQLNRSVGERSGRIAQAMHDAHVPLRDIGITLDPSHQRVHQLLSTGRGGDAIKAAFGDTSHVPDPVPADSSRNLAFGRRPAQASCPGIASPWTSAGDQRRAMWAAAAASRVSSAVTVISPRERGAPPD